jgi:hypothetical protein
MNCLFFAPFLIFAHLIFIERKGGNMSERKASVTELQAGYIQKMVEHVESLRVKAGISANELGPMIGLHRMSYANMVTGRIALSWRNYLALVFYFDCNHKTHDMLHRMGIYPDAFVEQINKQEP